MILKILTVNFTKVNTELVVNFDKHEALHMSQANCIS